MVAGRLILLLFNVLVIVGFHYATGYELDRDGKPTSKMALWWIKYYGLKYIGETWMKPISECVICMASVHSTYVYLPVFGFDYWYFVYIFALAGLAGLIRRKI